MHNVQNTKEFREKMHFIGSRGCGKFFFLIILISSYLYSCINNRIAENHVLHSCLISLIKFSLRDTIIWLLGFPTHIYRFLQPKQYRIEFSQLDTFSSPVFTSFQIETQVSAITNSSRMVTFFLHDAVEGLDTQNTAINLRFTL